jgi:flagellar hook capping protein FlgD
VTEALNPGLPSCDALDVKWAAATDASAPIRYLVYASKTLPVSLSEPVASTEALRTRISGLSYGTWYFVVRARDSQGNVDSNEEVRSVALACDPPSLVVKSFALTELQGCDADGRPDAGEYLNLSLVLHNTGSSDARNVFVQLRGQAPWVGTASDAVTFPDLPRAHFEPGTLPLQIHVASSTPCMTTVPLDLDIRADGGYHVIRQIQLMLESDLSGNQVVCDASASCNNVQVGHDLPAATRLGLPRPTPTRGPTSMSYAISGSDAGRVSVRIYDVAGRALKTLFDGERGPGQYEARWDGTDADGRAVRGGIYFARLEARGMRLTQRIVTLN